MEKIIVLPDHVIEEILLRLPVKDLLPWKCVSKRWYALIWDNEFIKKHYRFQYAMHLTAQGDAPLLLQNSQFVEPTEFHLLMKQGARDVVVNITPDFERDVVPSTFSHDSRQHERKMVCIGVVNGIVGLRQGLARLTLWNPATREFKDVPRSPIMLDNEDAKAFGGNIGDLEFGINGFGFDLNSNDFKVLGHICTNWTGTVYDGIFEFHLYSLRADSWKRIKGTPIYPLLFTPCTDAYFSNGVRYWISHDLDSTRFSIVAFNFSSETFKEFEPPRVGESLYKVNMAIGKYKEGLALFVDRTLESKKTCIEIWAAIKFRDDDYEVPSSWKIVVKTSPICEAGAYCLWSGAILGFGDIRLSIYHDEEVGDGRFAESGAYVYHTSTCTFNYLGIRFGTSYRFVESLFPLSRRLNYIEMTS